ncbi:MAG: secretin N-terminal domain-containing protein [Planctomycetota bacterium]
MSRNQTRRDRSTSRAIALLFALVVVLSPQARAAEGEVGMVRFSFSGVPWRDVIEWIADEANLALHMDSVPSGSFNYRDPSAFTHADAIDRINLFLLPKGYSLVRNGNLLSVIDLSDPRSMQQLDAIADLVTTAQLETRKPQEVVKCLFPLGALDSADAVEELSAIKLMVQPTILSKTKQLLIVDTVAKLKSVKTILDSFEPSQLDNGTIVKSFELKHVDAEDVLVVARPHLGLATGEMIGIDVSLSADLQGKFIFATGIEDKVLLIEKLVQSIDLPQPAQIQDDKTAELRTYKVVGGNVDLAYDVLLTLLAGQDARLSKNESAGTLVAFATPAVHRQIEGTIAKLAAEEPDFEVIPLRTVDPYVAIGLVEQMLNLSTFDDDDRDDDEIPPPNIDADPENRRLFVRGTPEQIAQIKKIVQGLDNNETGVGTKERIRLLPLYGSHAQQTLELAARFWQKPNPILLFESQTRRRNPERVLHGPNESSGSPNDLIDAVESLESRPPSQFVSASDRGRLLTSPAADVAEDAIECQMTSRGLLIQCNSLEVLDHFQEHVETLAGRAGSAPSEPIVYYLKYTRPDEALRMLAELIDGGEAVDPSSDSLVNATVSNDLLFGSLLTNREGTLTLIAGTLTVVADSRLNRLIAQGTSEDVELIEGYLRIIEKDSSITSVETYGRSRVIELVNTRATDVEAALRKAFAGRVAANTAGASAPQQGGGEGQREDPRAKEKAAGNDKNNAKKNAKAPSQQARDLEPKMTLAVHEPSNSLIVTAPEALYQEVEKLAMIIDDRAEQSIEILTPKSVVLEAVLEELVLGQSDNNNRRPSGSRDRDRDKDR